MVSVTFHNSVCTFIPVYNHLHDALINQKKIYYQVCCEKLINWTRFHQNGLVCLEMQTGAMTINSTNTKLLTTHTFMSVSDNLHL